MEMRPRSANLQRSQDGEVQAEDWGGWGESRTRKKASIAGVEGRMSGVREGGRR